jgi:hypothetical protein
MANRATATPARHKTEAIKTRRLKKADFEVDFFFMNEAELFPSPVNPEMDPESYVNCSNRVNTFLLI